VTIHNLPREFEGLKLTLVGDIQVDRYTQESKLRKLQAKLQDSKSDILFFSGDLVTSGQYYIDQGLETICAFSATIGKYACMGDHDFWSNPRKISQGMSACGWSFLRNSHQLIRWSGRTILVTGVTEIYSRKISAMELSALLTQAPAADLKILLLHQPSPRLIETAREQGYQLILAGHTHGGQVQFKPFGITLTPSMLETPYFSGLYQLEGASVVVTNGIGLTLAPIRYHASAEISVMTLTSN
jgi:predicted MPP superfamily phosphohydrolase